VTAATHIEEQVTAAIEEQATPAIKEQATPAIKEQARMTMANSSDLLASSEVYAEFGMEVDTVTKCFEDTPNSKAASDRLNPATNPSVIDVIDVDSFTLPQPANISLKPSDDNVIYDLSTPTKVKTAVNYDHDFGFTAPQSINAPLKPSYNDEIFDLSTPKKDRKDRKNKKNKGKENIMAKVGSIPRTPATAKLPTSIPSSMKRHSPDTGDVDSGRKTKRIRLSESSEFNSIKTMFVDDRVKREQFNGELLVQLKKSNAQYAQQVEDSRTFQGNLLTLLSNLAAQK
jgi:hypothetical protein